MPNSLKIVTTANSIIAYTATFNNIFYIKI